MITSLICSQYPNPVYFFFSSEVPQLLYYSHFPVLIVSLLLAIFVLINNKNRNSAIPFALVNISLAVWIMLNLVVWTQIRSDLIMFFWSIFGLVTFLICSFTFFFFKNFIDKKDFGLLPKTFWIIAILPIVFLMPTQYNLKEFSMQLCGAGGFESEIYLNYYHIMSVFMVVALVIYSFKKFFEKTDKNLRKEIVFVGGGSFFFLTTFLTTSLISSYGDNFEMEQYGLIASILFSLAITYSIVKFKAFDIKLIGSQALVWALVILIGSQFFFVETLVNQILVGITLVLSAIVGLIIVRSVKKEIAQREELAVANENQQLLIRFITHQVKGFFTKSKMVFASILEGDMGEASEPIKNLLKEGLDSDNKAVEMVQEVLKASSLRSGQMTYNLEETNMVDFIKEIAETFREMAVGKKLQYEINLPAESALAKVDKLQMTQVIKNLIDNSVKYTLEGFVHVNLKIMSVKEGKKVVKQAFFSVEDSGVGLSDGDKAKLFKEGGRGEESLKVNVNSTGYGLFIVKKIVEGHGGKIWAESHGRGHGTKFFVEIPLIESGQK